MNEKERLLNIDRFFWLEIKLNRLRKEKRITKKQEKEIRLILKPLRYKTYLSSPHLKENIKLKKEAELFCLNDYLFCKGLSKFIHFFNCENSA